MAKRKKRVGGGDSGGVNMTPMIDIVFQMIIFFVLTVQMERDQINEQIELAMSPHGPAVEQRDPRTVTIDVSDVGQLYIGPTRISEARLLQIMRSAVNQYGQTTPVVIRGDRNTPHEHIKRAMDICTRAGLFRIKFAAVKEAG